MEKKIRRFLTAGLLVVSCGILMGCASTITRTGYKTFILEGGIHGKKRPPDELVEKYLDRDASKLCCDRYRVIGRKIHPSPYNTESWGYVFEIECLDEVNEGFYDLHKEQAAVYIFY